MSVYIYTLYVHIGTRVYGSVPKIKLPLVHQLADVHALHLKAHVNVDFPCADVRVPYRAH